MRLCPQVTRFQRTPLMLPMHWLRGLVPGTLRNKAARHGRPRARQRRCGVKLRLEWLEDRLAPAVTAVKSVTDTISHPGGVVLPGDTLQYQVVVNNAAAGPT